VDENVALVGIEQSDHVLDAHRLSGARRPEDHRDLPLGQAHVQPAQDAVAPERLVDVDELDRIGHAGRPLEPGVPLILVLVRTGRLGDHGDAGFLRLVGVAGLLIGGPLGGDGVRAGDGLGGLDRLRGRDGSRDVTISSSAAAPPRRAPARLMGDRRLLDRRRLLDGLGIGRRLVLLGPAHALAARRGVRLLLRRVRLVVVLASTDSKRHA
jgi:hypothetical protein